MKNRHLLAGVAAVAVMAAAGGVQAQSAASNAAAIDALSKKVESMGSMGMGAAKGVKGVSLKVSGQINRAVMYVKDINNAAAITYVDNPGSNTRVRWDASAPMKNGMTVGGRLEMAMVSNDGGSATASTAKDAGGNTILTGRNAGGDAFTTRHSYVYVKGGFGQITTGQQSMAHDNIMYYNFNWPGLADFGPEHGVGGSYRAIGDGPRQDGIRYDTPSMGGAMASISSDTAGNVAVSANYTGSVGGFGISGGLAWATNQAGGKDGSTLAGSAGINFGKISLNTAFGMLMPNSADTTFYNYVSLAHKGNYMDMGPTSVGIDFDRRNGPALGTYVTTPGVTTAQANSTNSFTYARNSKSVGVALVQALAPGADGYASFRHTFGAQQSAANTPGLSWYERNAQQTVLVGMRVRF